MFEKHQRSAVSIFLTKAERVILRIFYLIISLPPFICNWFLKYYFSRKQKRFLINTGDPVRFGAVWLAIDDIEKKCITGAFAEAGVYRGDLSKFIHEKVPQRKLYLFDTFEGFPEQNLKGKIDNRFADTSVGIVKRNLNDLNNIIIRKGFFPETAQDLDEERFAFVMIDFDLYESTLAALRFFYPRMNKAGYIFLHDYCSTESEIGVSRATNEFLNDKNERVVCIPDACGSAIIRKS